MKIIYFYSLLLLSIFSCNAASNDKPSGVKSDGTTAKVNPNLEKPDIKIQVDGLTGGGTASVIGVYNEQNYKADALNISPSGGIVIKKDTSYLPGLYFVVLPNNKNFQMLIDEDQTFEMKTNINNLTGAMTVTGNKETELFYEVQKYESGYQQRVSPINQVIKSLQKGSATYEAKIAERDALVAERTAYLEDIFAKNPKTLFTSFKQSGQNPDLKKIYLPSGEIDEAGQVWHYRNEFWDNVNFDDERLMRTPVIANKLKRYIKDLTPQHQDSIIASASYLCDMTLNKPEYFKYFANWITLEYDPKESTLMDAHAVHVHMIQNYFTNERAFWSDSVQVFGLQQRAYEMAHSLLGQKAKNVIAPGPDGKLLSLYDLKSPYVIVYMYNPECEHCQEETPKLVEFHKEWKSKGVDVFAIAIDTDDAKWKDYIKTTGMTWSNVHDPTNKSIYPNYFVDITPEIYVLNKDRIFVAKNLKVEQLPIILNREMGL